MIHFQLHIKFFFTIQKFDSKNSNFAPRLFNFYARAIIQTRTWPHKSRIYLAARKSKLRIFDLRAAGRRVMANNGGVWRAREIQNDWFIFAYFGLRFSRKRCFMSALFRRIFSDMFSNGHQVILYKNMKVDSFSTDNSYIFLNPKYDKNQVRILLL